MLSPRWYAEDAMRIPQIAILYELGTACMELMASVDSLDRFLDLTSALEGAFSRDFDASRNYREDGVFLRPNGNALQCIICGHRYHLQNDQVSLLFRKGTHKQYVSPLPTPSAFRLIHQVHSSKLETGYYQKNFQTKCPHSRCGRLIIRSSLQAGKLAENLARPGILP